ncbi:MAG TPA: hypothetical protein DCQ64_03045 [Candidatus Rokubacteria bacterium]|nr:hypothetical protein [Candidatus Rokubacteria bacterium]
MQFPGTDRKVLDEAKTRLTVQEIANHWKLVDLICPSWARAMTVQSESGAHCTMYGQATGERSVDLPEVVVRIGKEEFYLPRRQFVMPFQNYLRALDPAGNLGPLTISTNRVDADDGCGTRDRTIAIKRRAGWWIAEPLMDHNGRDADTYGRALFLEMAKRRADHGAKMALADKENESRLERAFKEQQGAQTETLRTIVTMLAERLGAPAPAAGK